jgi:hypothetical protein
MLDILDFAAVHPYDVPVIHFAAGDTMNASKSAISSGSP